MVWTRPAAALITAFGVTASGAHEAHACLAAPPPLTSLSYDSRYVQGDATRSTVDEAGEAEALAALEPLDDFIRQMSQGVDAMMSAEAPARGAPADCLVSQLADWARADALAELGTQTVALTIGSRLAAFAIMAREIRRYTSRGRDLDVVIDWLGRRVAEQMVFWETAPEGAARGNLRAWAALAGAATADLADDAVMRAWSAWSTAYVLCTAAPDGSLPQEMSRGALAYHYQLHAVAPLVTTVLLLERQGVELRDTCNGALERAVTFALDDLGGGLATQAITGQPQNLFEDDAEIADFRLAWLEAYVQLTGDRRADRVAAPLRPLKYSKLGGNQTLLWAR